MPKVTFFQVFSHFSLKNFIRFFVNSSILKKYTFLRTTINQKDVIIATDKQKITA